VLSDLLKPGLSEIVSTLQSTRKYVCGKFAGGLALPCEQPACSSCVKNMRPHCNEKATDANPRCHLHETPRNPHVHCPEHHVVNGDRPLYRGEHKVRGVV
ncbi:uncharacterized protein SCHCODRAFT_02495940, partial [Schizophyllum commune H4-8]|uniref:uncharacterized protein n=1 Tax=Schizophyllum commune (strain H4-8 / FGSC 9210) TaxID=578458 RepID=UPI00215E6970